MTTARIAAFSCTHCPHTDHDAVQWALDQIVKFKPTHFVHMGDLLDADAASKHSDRGVKGHDLADEYDAAASLLTGIRKRLGKISYHWLHGNHDANILSTDPDRIDKSVRRMAHWDNHLAMREETSHWKQVPHIKDRRGVLRIGQVVLCHGFDAGEPSDRLESIQINNLADGESWRLVVRGHTHQPRQVTRLAIGKVELPHWYANVGHMGPPKPVYAERKDTARWGNALLLAETTVKRWYPTREWDAEIVRREGWW